MNFINIKWPKQTVTFTEAVRKGLGHQQGLFFPEQISRLPDIDSLLEMDFVSRSVQVLSPLVGECISTDTLSDMLRRAFNFPVVTRSVAPNMHAIELFHGPSLAFKDFGARFLAECLSLIDGEPTTILTATSGDTGAAVAHAFHGVKNVRAVILYPKGRISTLQEKLFCTLGDNIQTLAVEGDFDQCQAMVKMALDDAEVQKSIQLNSANSINVGRLLAQVCYYFEAVAQLSNRDSIVVSIPSGNFGNLTAGLIAQTMGLPIGRFIGATNANDTVPRYLRSGEWEPNATRSTLTNAMDISRPNNFPRIQWLAAQRDLPINQLIESFEITDEQTVDAMHRLFQLGYVAEPHTALAYTALNRAIEPHQQGLFLATAHPAKFEDVVEQKLGTSITLPKALESASQLPLLSQTIEPKFETLKTILLESQLAS